MATRFDETTTITSTRRLSWAGIIAGALVALSLSFLIHTFNLGIGLTALHRSADGMMALAIGGTIWLLICSIVTMFIAGALAGWFSRNVNTTPCLGAIHGFLAWSLALFLALTLAANFVGSLSYTEPRGGAQNIARDIGAAEHKSTALVPSSSAESTADTAGAATLGAFLNFFFGAIAAGVGGYYGASNRHLRKLDSET